jgi:malate dehydrogenase (oxaloacetate-decarboxylating)
MSRHTQHNVSESSSFVMRVSIANKKGMLGKTTALISRCGGIVESIDLAGFNNRKTYVFRDIAVQSTDVLHAQKIINAVRKLLGVTVESVSDSTFLAHLGGKIEIVSKIPLVTRKALSIAYTPGVARVSMAIANAPEKAFKLTIKKNTVAIVSDGTAVLGLGDIGAIAAIPVMEGKAAIFKEFAGIDAFPICLDAKDPEEIVRIVKAIAPVFGGINLEDISAPRCFEIEKRLRAELDIPVFHDDQHGTAVVVLAAMLNALKVVKKKMRDAKIVVAGIGAAGVAVSKILQRSGAQNIIGIDRTGAIYRGRIEHMNPVKQWYAEHTNREKLRGDVHAVIRGADVFIGLSGPNIISANDIKHMNKDAIVFAMANPVPEIMPEDAARFARIIATGRSDYPNQINNSLVFPGMFRGALDTRASEINEEMKCAAARAIAACVSPKELSEEYIVPSMFDKRVVPAVAEAVMRAAHATKVARRELKNWQEIHLQ